MRLKEESREMNMKFLDELELLKELNKSNARYGSTYENSKSYILSQLRNLEVDLKDAGLEEDVTLRFRHPISKF